MGFPIPLFLLMIFVLYGSTFFLLLFWSSLTFSSSLSSVFFSPFFFAMLSIEPQHYGQQHGKHSTYAGETIIEHAERATNI